MDEYLPQRHLARFVVEVVDQLDLLAMVNAYRGSDSASYRPATLPGLLIYRYATKVLSSRAIERGPTARWHFASLPAMSIRTTIRLPCSASAFCRTSRRCSWGCRGSPHDGDAQARHGRAGRDVGARQCEPAQRAVLYGQAKKLEKQLKREFKELLRLAEQAAAANIADGMSIPEELERREARLAAVAEAKEKIEARVSEREQTEFEAKLVARAERERITDKQSRAARLSGSKARLRTRSRST